MALPNSYFLIDDYGAGTTSGGGTGAGSGAPISPEFTAPSIAAAVQVAYIFATAFQRPVRLVQKYGGISAMPWTLVTGGLANIALTSVPSGIGY
jgi:hypothetical protein